MASIEDFRRAVRLRPDLFEECARLEEEIGHTLSPTRVPLRRLVA